MRKQLRKIAHYRMQKAGHVRVNKKCDGDRTYIDGSYFSRNWREFC